MVIIQIRQFRRFSATARAVRQALQQHRGFVVFRRREHLFRAVFRYALFDESAVSVAHFFAAPAVAVTHVGIALSVARFIICRRIYGNAVEFYFFDPRISVVFKFINGARTINFCQESGIVLVLRILVLDMIHAVPVARSKPCRDGFQHTVVAIPVIIGLPVRERHFIQPALITVVRALRIYGHAVVRSVQNRIPFVILLYGIISARIGLAFINNFAARRSIPDYLFCDRAMRIIFILFSVAQFFVFHFHKIAVYIVIIENVELFPFRVYENAAADQALRIAPRARRSVCALCLRIPAGRIIEAEQIIVKRPIIVRGRNRTA